ncbi:MAG TPA: prohibitin family protein [Methylomirabilota bacterium]|nr:prohibitin family protein [Methylomirabilota bacterium]
MNNNSGIGQVAGWTFFVFVALVAITIAFGSWYTIDQTRRGILLRNGAFVEVVQPGLHFKWPWIEDVYKVDMQTHTHTWEKMEAYSADQQPAFLKVSVTLHIAADKVPEIYSRFGGDIEAAISRLIAPHIAERTKVVFGQYTAAKAIVARGQLNIDAGKALMDAIAYDPVFTIESVQVEDVAFSGEYIKSVEARMMAEVEVQKLRQNLEREKVQAEIAVTQATGRANSVRAEAQAQADAITLRGNAEATAIAARGKALGDNPHLVSLVQAEKWNGTLPTTMLPGGAVPFVSLGTTSK